MLKFYGLKNCSTCKRAEKWMEAQGISYDYIDIREEAPSKELLIRALSAVDNNPRKIMNTSGQLYRDMDLKDKLDDMTDGEVINLLAKHGMLVKRPFIADDLRLTVGAKEEVLEEVWKD